MVKDLSKTTFCDNCIHKKVCVYKEDVIRFTNNVITDLKYMPSVLEINFNCQEKEKIIAVPRMETPRDARKAGYQE